MLNSLIKPIRGIENRTAQEVFDIMCSRITAMREQFVPVAFWYRHPEEVDDPFGVLPLTVADKANGWTETPLYAFPAAPTEGEG